MASLQSIAIASALFLILLVDQGSSLSCYQCNSKNETRCSLTDDNLPSEFKKPCGKYKSMDGQQKEHTLCRKITQVIEFAVLDLPPDTRVIRQCGWDNSSYQGRCYNRAGFGGRQEVCACFDDNCNGANSISLVLGATLVSALLAFFARV